MGSKSRSRRTWKGPPLAAAADPLRLYQKSVQAPENDIEFFASTFRALRGREPLSLREDFCGTAYLSTLWALGDPRRTAIGIDLDEATLDWGRRHNLQPAAEALGGRVELIAADVLDGAGPATDVTCAMNFSFCVFKKRQELKRYLDVVYRGLADDGIFFSELYGGTEAIVEFEEERPLDHFTYVWEQASFNPITNETVCHIHFDFEDGTRLEKAFTYDWRLWSLPEIRDLLEEVGFGSVGFYWEQVDEEGDGTGEHALTEEEENQETWLVYIVAAK